MRKSLLFLTGIAVAGGIALAVPASAQTSVISNGGNGGGVISNGGSVISNGGGGVISNATHCGPQNPCN